MANCIKEIPKQDVIVIGGNHHNTLGVIRALGFKGVMPIVLLITDETKPYISYSKYISECIILKHTQDIVPFLLNRAKKTKGRHVIISCADFATSELDASFDQLKESYHLPTAKEQGVCNQFMNKDTMAILAQKVGIETPKRWIFEESSSVDINDIVTPCIVKPLASIYGSKSEIKICHDITSLTQYLSDNKDHQFIIQEYIDKDFEYQLIGCSLNFGEEIIIPGYAKCIRPCPGTNTGFLEYKPLEDFDCNISACKEFIKTIGYQGLFSMEYLRDKNGKDYFLEINMRNDGNAICVTGAGVNLPYIWYQYCVGDNYNIEATQKILDIFVMPEFDDFLLLLKGKVNIIRWIKDLFRSKVYMEYDKHDKKPFFVGLRNMFGNYIRLILLKIHLLK